MKTSDGYIVKTSDEIYIKGKDPNDYNYPLKSNISPATNYTSEIDP